ncbi:FLAVONOL 3-O-GLUCOSYLTRANSFERASE UGT71C4 [Salix koriyanagi]|uniref:FLAVONOL 3-O-GLUCOSYLTRANSFERASE UGT71C4 n=1 Tax=Salix koriyanagi TaxID=2511006 RepID=A0A9Q0VFJ6_9ROSI|nr:FLAVONOL 3-O-GLUCOSYLTRANSFERASE UGT71C4 [Salix koriyanagi]
MKQNESPRTEREVVLATTRERKSNRSNHLSDHYHYLPGPCLPSNQALSVSVERAFTRYINDHKTIVKDVIVNQVIANDPAPIASVVFDLFCTAFIDVAKELGVPSHVFFTSGAAFLGLMLYLSDREENGQPKFRPTDPDYIIPFYANPAPYRVLPRDCPTDIVRAEDITKAVKTMMEQGGEFRNKAKAISEMAQKAVAEGGSSYVTLGNLINQWLENNP